MIADKINISDGFGPHGYVVLRDSKTGKIIFQGHNMVTRAGKEYILYSFLSAALGVLPSKADVTDVADDDKVTSAFTEINGISRYGLKKCKLGSDNSATSYTATSLSSPIPGCIFPIGQESKVGYKVQVNAKTGENYIQFSIRNITGNGETMFVSELGLYLSTDDDSTDSDADLLFSRIAFDPIPFTENNEFSLDYYIYF